MDRLPFALKFEVMSSARVDLKTLVSKFCLFPAISLLFRVGGRAASRVLDIAKIQLTQSSLVELEFGLSLAKLEKLGNYIKASIHMLQIH